MGLTPPRLLVTAGPTHEPIDEVRYIANRSSGRMGLALAAAGSASGFPTTLLLGPTHLQPFGTNLAVHRFRSAADLEALLTVLWPDHDVLIMAAAVSDYRPRHRAAGKLRRDAGGLTLELESTPDLVGGLAERSRPDQYRIGFALAARDVLDDVSREKLDAKHLDAIVANPLETMDAAEIEGVLIDRSGGRASPGGAVSKESFAQWLVDAAAARWREKARENVTDSRDV